VKEAHVVEKGKRITIKGEELTIYPGHCTKTVRNCATCAIEGKIQCEPRFWPEGGGDTEVIAEASTEVTAEVISERKQMSNYKLTSTWRKHEYFDAHRAEIIADIMSLGISKGLGKWGMSKGAWTTARRLWREDLVRAGYDPYAKLRRKKGAVVLPKGEGNAPTTREQLAWYRRGWDACRRHFMAKLNELFLEK
jgi:hypothetical protein